MPHFEKAKEAHNRFNAKIRFYILIEMKRFFQITNALDECKSFISDYESQQSIVWKYLYRVNTMLALIFQNLSSFEISITYLNAAKDLIDRNAPVKSKHHGIIQRITGFYLMKLYKKSKAEVHLRLA